MALIKMLSSDSHVVEPPDLWTERMSPQFRDRAPRVVREDDGDWWYVDGYRTNSFQGGAQPGLRFDNPEELKPAAQFDEVRPGAYQPEAHLQENETDGIYGSVLYPTEGLLLFSVPDSKLVSDIFRAYNDWIAEFCSGYTDRLKGIAMINLDDVLEGVTELSRARKLGLAGGMISVDPPESKPYDHPDYEPFWAAAQDLDMPLSLHIATNRPSADKWEAFRGIKPSVFANADHWVRLSLGHMIFAGVFERYPQLRVGSVEHELSWVPHFIDRLDYTYTQRAHRDGWIRFKSDALPSDFFRRQVFLSFQEDALGIRDRELIGVDNLMWGSDYPHTESTFPRSQDILDHILADVPVEERRQITRSNVERLYHFDLE